MLPISRLNTVLKELDRNEKAHAYFNSISVARLAHIVISGLGGEKAARSVKIEDLMPFRLSDIYDKTESDCTPRTISVIKKLIRMGRMPLVLIPILRDEIDQ